MDRSATHGMTGVAGKPGCTAEPGKIEVARAHRQALRPPTMTTRGPPLRDGAALSSPRATACYDACMETVTHREMRNRSGEILRRVEAGESVRVSNNGHLAALIVPIGGDSLAALIARGEARAPRTSTAQLANITPVESPLSSRELLEDSRGRW